MNVDVVSVKESDVEIYNTKEEKNIVNRNLNTNNEKIEIPKSHNGSKLLAFIKAKPLFFTLIVISTCAVVTVAIVVPIVIINKNNNDSKGDEKTTVPNIDHNGNYFNDDNIGNNNGNNGNNGSNENNNGDNGNNGSNENNNGDNGNNGNNENNNGDNGNNDNYINDEFPNLNNIVNIDNSKLFVFNNIDTEYTNIFGVINDSYDDFCSKLKGFSTSLDSYQKVYLIYQWVTKNINYDYDSYKEGNLPNCEPINVFSSKLTVCSGYSRLFTALLKCLNFPEDDIQNIIGHSKGLGFDIEKELTDENTDHEWNAVKLGDKWCLIDTTWGAGSIKNEVFQKLYSEYYLCTPPQQFVRTHLPRTTQEQFQLLENTINIDTFKNMAHTTNSFFEYGFIGLANDKAIQNFCGEGKIILKYEGIRPILLVKIKKDGEINNWIMQEKITNGYNINFYINEAGIYNLEVSSKKREENYFHSIVNFQKKCFSTLKIKKYFPTFTLDYDLDDSSKIISPLDNELIQGEKYNFKIESSYDSLFLLIGNENNYENIEMNKDGISFIENDVIIHGNEVKISYKDIDNLYYPLVQYITKGETINFPKSFSTPFKKRLESPFESNLRIGETYNFKIICDINENAAYNIYLHDGSNFIDMNKEGNIYTKEITISSISELKVLYGPIPPENNYKS